MATDITLVNTAQLYYVELMKEPDEISELINIPTRTIRSWVSKKGWKKLRDTKLNSQTKNIQNIKQLIANLAEQQLELQEQRSEAVRAGDKVLVQEIDEQCVNISDQASKWNKHLESETKKGKIPLETYLFVMDRVFKSLREHDNKLYLSTIKFQQEHVENISNELD